VARIPARHSGFFRRDAERCDRDGRASQAMEFVALGQGFEAILRD
jgi:hypothetical protein